MELSQTIDKVLEHYDLEEYENDWEYLLDDVTFDVMDLLYPDLKAYTPEWDKAYEEILSAVTKKCSY